MSTISGSSRTNSVSPSQSLSSSQSTHTVKKGETMTSIARQHSVALDDLKKANPQVSDPDVIHPGQQLNLPSQQGTASAQTAGTAGTQPSPYQDPTSRFEAAQRAPQPQVQADPNAPAPAAPAADPTLTAQLNAQRAVQNAAGPRGAAQAPSTLHSPTADGRLGASTTNLGFEGQRSAGYLRDSQGRTVTSSSSTSTTHSADGLSTSVHNREAMGRNQQGQSVHSLSESVDIRDRRTGQSVSENTRVSQGSNGRLRGSTETDEEEEGIERRPADSVNATGRLFETTLAGDNQYHGVATVDHRMTRDETGAGYEAHALAAQGKVDAGGTVNLKSGEVNVGVNAQGRADLVGASGRAQVGSTSTTAGAGFVEGEAHVGARGEAGAGVGVDLSRGEVQARIGGEVFAGAEVRGTAGYENRYGGVSVTARGQAGIGGAAGAEVSLKDGNLRAHADLGAAVGLGGRVTVDVNVNLGNVASDAWEGVKDGAGAVSNFVGGLFD